jgi:hypothetical protein
MLATFALDPAQFTACERPLLRAEALAATAFRYDTGVAALRLTNARGSLVVLPWMGQIVWDAVFDGVRLTMGSLFDAPRPATEIIDTYGCFAFHSGLLRNGCPGPDDTHLLHGEMACAAMDSASLTAGEDETGPFLRLDSERLFVRGFGNRYRARPSVTLRPGATLFDIGLAVENTGGRPMDLMYMCHVNFAFVPGGEIIQPAPFDARSVAVRTAIPAHVPDDPAYRARIAALAEDPSPTRYLDEGYDPEQVFYLHGLGQDAAGETHLMLRRPAGDGFALSYRPARFPHTVRWLLCNADHQVAAFALPSTCQPEGYLAELAKGHVQSLPPGGQAAFTVRAGYLDADAAAQQAARIAATGSDVQRC